jgi:hypothetical protein
MFLNKGSEVGSIFKNESAKRLHERMKERGRLFDSQRYQSKPEILSSGTVRSQKTTLGFNSVQKLPQYSKTGGMLKPVSYLKNNNLHPDEAFKRV